MRSDLWDLYRRMLRCRLVEELVRDLWNEGRVSGEMHLGLGEEAIVVGVVGHLRDGDAMALDHRGTAPLVARGVELAPLLAEMLGREDGLCGGRGGHMHLFSRDHLAASSGIVGAAGPAAAGFALAGAELRPGSVAVAFFGEGAMNQGMLLESLNLAVAWKLPVLFVCKNNGWAITTRSTRVTGGDLSARAAAFGLAAERVDGREIEVVRTVVGRLLGRVRSGGGPAFVEAACDHLEGHFLGDPLLRVVRRPVVEARSLAGPLTRAATGREGAGVVGRARSLAGMTRTIGGAAFAEKLRRGDPLPPVRRRLRRRDASRLEKIERAVAAEVASAAEALEAA
jgi:pyruvate dehydrogenase E1 component alpha subunit